MKKYINLIRDYHDCHQESQMDCDCQFVDIHQNIYENIKKECINKGKLINYLKNNIANGCCYTEEILDSDLNLDKDRDKYTPVSDLITKIEKGEFND